MTVQDLSNNLAPFYDLILQRKRLLILDKLITIHHPLKNV